MKSNKLLVLLVSLFVLLVVLSQSLFVVNEGTKAIKLRFNKVIRDGDTVKVYEPGLHFKPPFIDSVVYLDARVQNLIESDERFLTIEKKDVLINSYVKWKVKNFDRFYTATSGGQFYIANNLLRRKISDTLRSEVANQTISEIVSGTRGELMSQALRELNKAGDVADTLGIDVIDVRVNKIELPNEVSNSIYQRMTAERKAVAGEHRAKGQEEAQRITAETDRNVQVIIAQANLEAQKLRAQADAQAAKILNDTYAQSEDLFNFLTNLKAYSNSIKNYNTVLLIKPNKESFYGYLFNNGLVSTPANGKINPELKNAINNLSNLTLTNDKVSDKVNDKVNNKTNDKANVNSLPTVQEQQAQPVTNSNETDNQGNQSNLDSQEQPKEPAPQEQPKEPVRP